MKSLGMGLEGIVRTLEYQERKNSYGSQRRVFQMKNWNGKWAWNIDEVISEIQMSKDKKSEGDKEMWIF